MATEKLIGVLGAGPVGTVLAAAFASSGQKVVLVEAAEERRKQIKRNGLMVGGVMPFSVRPSELVSSLDALGDRPLHAMFICTKTWSLRRILPALAEVLGPRTLVVANQNGIGPEEEVARCFPRELVARGVVNFAGGVDPETGNVTMHWFNGPNIFGALEPGASPLLEGLADQLNRAGLDTEVVPGVEVKKRAFFKSVLNASLMPLCASTNMTMKQAMTFANTRHLCTRLLREGFAVGAALGYHYGETTLDQALAYLDKGGDHKPSMWVDLQQQCPTEIEYINGKIAELGDMFSGLDVSANRFFTSMVVTLEITAGIREPDDVPAYLTRD